MPKIKEIRAREILDSRANPTVSTTVVLDDGTKATYAVSSGASIGRFEVIELRDKDFNRYGGMGVLKAIDNVNQIIAPKIIGSDPQEQEKIDKIMVELDGTPDKSKLGSNSILSVSLAVAMAAANSTKQPLYQYLNKLFKEKLPTKMEKIPTPTFNIINGGKHGAGTLDFQEFQVVPASSKTYSESLRMGVEIYQKLREVLIYRNEIHSIGDEGGFAPNLFTSLDALDLLVEAIKGTSYVFGKDVFLGLDIAATHFKKSDGYHIKERPLPLSSDDFIAYLEDLETQYHLLILEDPLEENDWEGWQRVTKEFGDKTLIVGDDLLVTNPQRLKQAVSMKACTAILVKLNQIGTLSETMDVVKMARQAKIKTVVSHRSGETNDTFIADFAVAIASEYVKFGAPARGERVAKYNRLLEIEEELNLK